MTKAELEAAVRTGDWMTGATLDEVEEPWTPCSEPIAHRSAR
jgi:hypothetical protein